MPWRKSAPDFLKPAAHRRTGAVAPGRSQLSTRIQLGPLTAAGTPCALRMRDPQRATGLHSVPPSAFATACTRHALSWPWPWALPVGTAAADTANCTVAAVCARSKALGVLAVNLHASRFANSVCNADTLSEMLIADTLCTANSVGTALHRKQCLQSTIQFFSFANTLCKHSQQTLTVLSRHFGKRSYKSTSQTLQSCTDLQAL